MERLTEQKRNSDGTGISKQSLIDRPGKGYPSLYCKKILTKLAEYEDSEEQGKLLKLTCKVGGKIWSITSTENYSSGEYKENLLPHPQEKKIVSITICKNGIILYHVKDRAFASFEFGETVFLTKEEAEQVLNEKKKVLGSEHE
ncbi:MAG: hypothetical protein HFJ09_08620 [Lachnospiraceae bacterium]|nr:hypothetical protein [Lachnospiraceae bacterium]